MGGNLGSCILLVGDLVTGIEVRTFRVSKRGISGLFIGSEGIWKKLDVHDVKSRFDADGGQRMPKGIAILGSNFTIAGIQWLISAASI